MAIARCRDSKPYKNVYTLGLQSKVHQIERDVTGEIETSNVALRRWDIDYMQMHLWMRFVLNDLTAKY